MINVPNKSGIKPIRHPISPVLLLMFLGLVCTVGWTVPVHALTLNDAIEQALHNDPIFLAARANLAANQARSSQAIGRLMPQITASANANSNRRDYATKSERYNSHGVQVNLTQPLLHAEKFIALNQADLLMSQANYQLLSAEQDLLIRVVQAWLDIQQARNAISASDRKLAASEMELELSRRAQANGLMSRTELEATQTKRDQAQSEQVAAQTEYSLKLATLEQIIGQEVVSTDMPADHELSERYASLNPEQSTIEQWIAQSENSSPAILAARRAVDAAREEVNKQRAGHLPTLDFIASYNNATQGSGLIGGQAGFHNIVNSIGVQLNVPLFSGGEQNAKIGEALAMLDKARYELEAARRNSHLKIKQAWLICKSSFARQQFGKQAVKSATLTLKSAESQRAHGLKTDLDVLQARQQRDEVIRDLNKANNDLVLNYLKLSAETGQLSQAEILGMTRNAKEPPNERYGNE